MADLVIRNGVVVTSSGIINGGVAVEQGVITHVGCDRVLPAAKSVVDAQGNCILPGIIDPHGLFGRVHWEHQAKLESIHAAVNGITTIITYVQMGDMTAPRRLPIHQEAKRICEQNSFVDFRFNAVIGTDDQIQEIPGMVENGVSSFNFWVNLSQVERVQYGFPALDWAFFYRACEKIADCGPPAFASVHLEEPEIIHMLMERYKATGRQDLETWAQARPPFTEAAQAFTAGLIGLELGVPINMVHLAAPESLDAIKYFRHRGGRVYGETCPQYLAVSPTKKIGLLGKGMPPLRGKEYQKQLWKGVSDGTIDIIGSDHQIAKRKDKEVEGGLWGEPTEASGSGCGLMGSIFPIMMSDGVNKNRITIEQFVKLCSENTAKIFSIYPKKGTLAPGSDADIIIVNPRQEWEMNAESLKSSSDFCIFEGTQVKGKVVRTYVRGELITQDGRLVAETPKGQYV
jgi:dihydropyrimidinase/dihydroorotase